MMITPIARHHDFTTTFEPPEPSPEWRSIGQMGALCNHSAEALKGRVKRHNPLTHFLFDTRREGDVRHPKLDPEGCRFAVAWLISSQHVSLQNTTNHNDCARVHLPLQACYIEQSYCEDRDECMYLEYPVPGPVSNFSDQIVEWAFGKRMTPAERLRKHQRALEKTQRELDRERTKLENQEKKLVQDIKKSAKAGQIGACKIQAKDLVRTRR